MLVGGGSGGHITPLLAVANEIKKIDQKASIYYVIEKNSAFDSLVAQNSNFEKVIHIHAGKFRRYANQSLIAKVFDVKTLFLNIRDVFYVAQGYLEARKALKQLRPDIVFIKGGFVAVPIGLACKKLGIKYITHDSDTVPGLANKLIADKAVLNCTGMPERFYTYDASKVTYTGIPISTDYQTVNKEQQKVFKKELNIPSDSKVVYVTGGSQGAQTVNKIVELIAPDLLNEYKNVFLIHQTGKNNSPITTLSDDVLGRYRFEEYFADMYKYSGAADVIIARAGANTIAEIAAQGKAAIIIPNPYLTGSHQIANAVFLKHAAATVVLDESQLKETPELLLKAIEQILSDREYANRLQTNIKTFAKPEAAKTIAKIIIEKGR